MTYKELSDDVSNLLDDLHIKTCIIVGHSIGAKTAMCLSTKFDERIKGLVIMDAAPLDYINLPSIYQSNYDAIKRAYNFKKSFENFNEEFENSVRKITYNLFLENIIQNSNDIKWKCNLNSIFLNFRHLIGFEKFEEKYTNDVLILIGERSHRFRASHYRDIFPLIETKDIKIIKKAGY